MSKINNGNGITIRMDQVHFPTLEVRHHFEFEYDGKAARLTVEHLYIDNEVFINGFVETFEAGDWDADHDPAWTERLYELFGPDFVDEAEKEMKLPDDFLQMIEKRLEAVAAPAEIPAGGAQTAAILEQLSKRSHAVDPS